MPGVQDEISADSKIAPAIMEGSDLLTEVNKRFNQMMFELQVWTPALKNLSIYIDPSRGIFNNDRSNVGKEIDHRTLLDSHGTYCKRITSSGMQTGMTDPARPWFKLTMDNVLLENIKGLGEWLDIVTSRMIRILDKSNLYKCFEHCYDEIVQFGTGCYIIVKDYQDTVRGQSFTNGEYMLGVDDKGRVNSFAREFTMTVEQMVSEFGYDNLSMTAQSYWKNNQRNQTVWIRHLIEENKSRIPGYEDFENMKYRSVYWESGQANIGTKKFLAKRGFKIFRVIAPRWETVTTDQVLGYGPGRNAIGDIKQLQAITADMLVATAKLAKPPVVQDGSVTGHSNTIPGGVTKTSTNVPNSGVRAAYQVDPHIQEFNLMIDALYEKISKHMFSKFFLMISNLAEGQSPDITAFQVAQMKQEQMMMLGPVLFGLNGEMHTPTIDIVFDDMLESGLIPPPPSGIPNGTEIKVQFISILAQAQALIGVQQIETAIGVIGNINAVMPGATDIINVDEAGKEILKGYMVPSKIINDPDTIAKLRADRAAMMQQQRMLQAGQVMSDAANKLGNTPAGQGSVLDSLAGATGKAIGG